MSSSSLFRCRMLPRTWWTWSTPEPAAMSPSRSAPMSCVKAIEKVANDDAVFSPKLAGFVLDAFTALTPADVDDEWASLTAREREVLQYIARGYTYRETGEALFISVKTVESHVGSVLRKLQLTNRNELTRWAAKRELI